MANCRSHCRKCNTHFSSDSAFDAHRVFEEGHKDDWEHRTCADLHESRTRDGGLRFAVHDEQAKCAVASVLSRHPVRVWTLATHLERSNPWARAR